MTSPPGLRLPRLPSCSGAGRAVERRPARPCPGRDLPHAEDLRAALLLRALERCEVDAGRLHLDLTAVRFSGGYDRSALVKKGWAADRTIGRQVKTLQASTRSGVAVYFRPHQGAKSELPSFMEAVETLAVSLPPGLVVVADSGLGYLENLCALDTSKVGFVVPLRADTGWAERFVADVEGGLGPSGASSTAPSASNGCQRKNRRFGRGCSVASPSLPRTGPATTSVRLHLVLRGGGLGERRSRAGLQKAIEALERVRNGLGGRYYKTKRQVDDRVAVVLSGKVAGLISVETGEADGKPTITWRRDNEAIAKAGARRPLRPGDEPPARTVVVSQRLRC